jgi:hypothetical protein
VKRLSFVTSIKLEHLDGPIDAEVIYDMWDTSVLFGSYPSALRVVIFHVIADVGGLEEDVKLLLSESEHERLERIAEGRYIDDREEAKAMWRSENI